MQRMWVWVGLVGILVLAACGSDTTTDKKTGEMTSAIPMPHCNGIEVARKIRLMMGR